MKRIAVLLTVFNRRETTLRCLKELFNQADTNEYSIDVFLTNDGCTDGTPEAVREKFPQVHIITGDGSLYWNRGMIAAWKEAEKSVFDYFLLLNDDTNLFENALKSLINISENGFEKDIIVGAVMNSNRTRITYGGRSKFKGLITSWNGPTQCDTFNGNVVLIPKCVYDAIGKLDPTFHHGIGDSDYGLRATKAGFRCIIAPEPIGICDSHDKLPKWCDPEVPVTKRFKYLYAPGGNGNNPIQFFIFRKRHYGLIPAIKSFITNHIRATFPNINRKDADKY